MSCYLKALASRLAFLSIGDTSVSALTTGGTIWACYMPGETVFICNDRRTIPLLQ